MPNRLLPLPAVIACLAVGCGEQPTSAPAATAAGAQATAGLPATAPATKADGLIADNGQTLWASPTDGDPIDLSGVPDSASLVLHLRPQRLLSSDEGARVWRALGPSGDDARHAIESAAGRPISDIDTLLVGVTPGESYDEVTTTLAADPEPSEGLPLLQREIEQLLESTDRDRLLTLVFSPRFLLGDGGSLLSGPWAPLRDLALAQLRDDWSAASLSLHLDTESRLYWELRVLASVARSESQVAAAVAKQSRGWSGDLGEVVDAGNWSPYSAEVVRRSPAMTKVLSKYARRGVDGRQAVLNGYAPPGAAHQLLLAGERIVAELAAPPAATTPPAADEPTKASLAANLRKRVTIAFRREPLETAVTILSDALGYPIEIRGRDLQLEGITRNQMLGLNVQQMSVADALVEVLRRANPDPLATGPDDPRQKLVYLVEDDRLIITTRAAAERRGADLPAPFQSR